MRILAHVLYFIIFQIAEAKSAQDSIYKFDWLDQENEIYVIQNKEFSKAGKFILESSLINSNSSPYQNTIGLGLTMNYNLNEEWAIDFTYKKYQNSNNKNYNNLINAYESEVKPLITKIQSAKIVHINWTPFYGKINTFNKIFYFDWGVGLGIGEFETQTNFRTFMDKNKKLSFDNYNDQGMNIKTKFQFFIHEKIIFGINYDVSIINSIQSPSGNKSSLYNTELTFSLGLMI